MLGPKNSDIFPKVHRVLKYVCFRNALGPDFTEPAGYPDLHAFRRVEMYTRACTEKVKEKILEDFLKAWGHFAHCGCHHCIWYGHGLPRH